MSKVLLKYWFIFDPSETMWDRVGSFSDFLHKAFGAVNLQAERIETPEDETEIKIFISPKPEAPPIPIEKGPSVVLRNLKKKRGFDGKFKKENK